MAEGNYKDHLYALIGVGGGGTRLWPRSRNKTPKQFLKLFNGRTLIQITAYRFNKMLPWEKIFAVTVSEEYKKEIKKEVPEFIEKNIIVEPARRETGPAYALGALHIHHQDKDAVIVNGHSDHLMNPDKEYFKAMKAAAKVAYEGDWLVATGVPPTYPNVGYGYIKRGRRQGVYNGKRVYKLDKFTEKPKLSVAEKYLKSGDYYWNAGQYTWRADSILKAFKKHEPEVYKQIEIISKALGTKKEQVVIKKAYKNMPKVAIDYAISEKAKNFLLVIAGYVWVDVGDWNEVWKQLPKDAGGNVIIDGDEPGGDIINLDTSDALIHTNGRLVAVVDVDNIVIVDTKDALLICSKSKAQNVKKIVNELKERGKKNLL